MSVPELQPENSAAWRKLWELIASRILEQDSLAQEAKEREVDDDYANSKNSAG